MKQEPKTNPGCKSIFKNDAEAIRDSFNTAIIRYINLMEKSQWNEVRAN